jgi:acetyltransferase-like isoleucine patch superfamily enzyme
VIGAGSVFTSNCLIQCSTSIEIGERCAFGQSVLIVDGYHRYTGLENHWLDQGYDYRPIRIGDGAGISAKCTIQADVGERSMIANHSVVNRPIPAYCVAAGAPARVVRYFGPADQRPDGARPLDDERATAGE